MVLWIIQRLSGVGLVVLLGIHLFLIHYLKPGQTPTSVEVYERMQVLPLAIVDGTLLLFALFHGLQGLYTIVTDLDLSPWGRGLAAAICTFGGIGFFVWGIRILMAFLQSAS